MQGKSPISGIECAHRSLKVRYINCIGSTVGETITAEVLDSLPVGISRVQLAHSISPSVRSFLQLISACASHRSLCPDPLPSKVHSYLTEITLRTCLCLPKSDRDRKQAPKVLLGLVPFSGALFPANSALPHIIGGESPTLIYYRPLRPSARRLNGQITLADLQVGHLTPPRHVGPCRCYITASKGTLHLLTRIYTLCVTTMSRSFAIRVTDLNWPLCLPRPHRNRLDRSFLL